MKVFLDDTPVASTDCSLGGALGAAIAAARERGRVVVEARADGAVVPDDHLTNPPAVAPYAAELRLVSAEPRSLVRTTLGDAADFLSRAVELQREAAGLLQVGKSREAVALLPEIFGIWDAARRAIIDGCGLLSLSVDEALRRAGAAGLNNELAACLEEVKRSLGAADWTSLADALAYDLVERAGAWQAAMRGFERSLR